MEYGLDCLIYFSLNSSLCLQAGLSQVHFTAERSSYYHQLTQAEEQAKSQKLKVLVLLPVPRCEIECLPRCSGANV